MIAPSSPRQVHNKSVLTPDERNYLDRLERDIEKGITCHFSFVGQALCRIQRLRLYLPFKNIVEYGKEVWGFGRRTTYHYMEAARVYEELSQLEIDPPHHQSHCLALYILTPEERRNAWFEIVRRVSNNLRKVTERLINTVIAEIRQNGGSASATLSRSASSSPAPAKTFVQSLSAPASQLSSPYHYGEYYGGGGHDACEYVRDVYAQEFHGASIEYQKPMVTSYDYSEFGGGEYVNEFPIKIEPNFHGNPEMKEADQACAETLIMLATAYQVTR
eukprot:Sdes_comp15580_c0_seq1m4559